MVPGTKKELEGTKQWIITNLLDVLITTGKFLLLLVSITTMDSKELAGLAGS